ncbi:MAG: DUF3768 domain-containing protein [Xanthobacteraceae bacterium]
MPNEVIEGDTCPGTQKSQTGNEAVHTFDLSEQFEAEGVPIFFKIDYFDNSLSWHSPDPTDPSVTKPRSSAPRREPPAMPSTSLAGSECIVSCSEKRRATIKRCLFLATQPRSILKRASTSIARGCFRGTE